MNDNLGHWKKCLNKDLPYVLIIISSYSCRASMNSYAGAELAFIRSRSLPSPNEKNPLGRTVKTLEEGTLGINTKGYTLTNKTPKRIRITKMEEGMVPVEKGMMIIGHRDLKSYAK